MGGPTTVSAPAPLPPQWTDARRLARTGVLIVLIAFGAGGTWAAMVPLAGAVIAPGVVKVADNRKTMQHLEGGIVKEILVRDGDRVQARQPLLVLQDERLNARVDLLAGQLDAAMAKAARLHAERDRLPQPSFPERLQQRGATDTRVGELVRAESLLFQTRRRGLERQTELLAVQRTEIDEEIDGLEVQLMAEETAADLLAQELAANEQLQQSRAVAKVTVLALKRRLQAYHASRGGLQAAVARARQRSAGLQLRIVALRNQYMQGAADELTAVNAAIFDLEQRLRSARDAAKRQAVRAPTAGKVVALRVFTVGGVVRPGEPLLDIVPNDAPLMIEARIHVDDIDSVRPGMPADIRLTAFHGRTTPLLGGVLTYVSADQLIDPDTGTPHYVVHIGVDPESLPVGEMVRLHPGMHAEVFLRSGERTALAYLLEPLTASLRRALREP